MKIIEEERKRVLALSEHAKKGTEHRLEPVLCFLSWELRYGWLLSNDQPKFGDKIDHELAVQTNRFADMVSPSRQFCLVPTQNLANQNLECLGKGRIRNVSFVLIELA